MKKSEVIPIGLMLWLCMYGTAWPQDSKFIIPIASNDPTTITQGTQQAPLQVQSGSRPVPDPTTLTAEAIRELRRELQLLYQERFLDIVKQLDRLTLRLDRTPNDIKEAITDSEKLTSEKFKGLSDQQVQRDNNLALALTAAQKSVADTNLSNNTAAEKAEKNFKEQIAGIQLLLGQQEKTNTDKLNDLKDGLATARAELATRLQTIESSKEGSGAAINWIVIAAGFILTIVTIVGGLIGIFIALRRDPPAPLPVMNVAPEPIHRRRT